ncbi:unnamed protein product [Pieris brassicae]|uniref:HEAT repeat-containing protein 1 n=1 Tax=Pieris brassicae TaxID=7116 RepID=A0A9P0SEY5_PIEBR|nr:unnamed protein product [Pieris brassicae]
MASTSLSEQLKKLSTPQTSIYKDDKKRVSLLFDPKEAALKDRETFYEIGLSGLNELIALYEGFRVYEDSLFSVSSKDFERAVQTKEVNINLDQTIEKILLELSPYMLLQSSHKAVEWLVNRYHIHEYNQDAIMALILPYHETKIFIRFVQIMDSSSIKWKWLEPIKQHGIPLSKLVLHKQCMSNVSTLQFIAKSTLKYVAHFGERATQLNTVFAFFCSTAIGCMHNSQTISEAILIALLPTLISALESPIDDFRSSAYIILGFLTTKAKLKKKIVKEIMDKLLSSEFEITQDVVLLMNLIYTNQKHITKMSDDLLNNISLDLLSTICSFLKTLSQGNINILPFILAFLSGVLSKIQLSSEEFIVFSKLPTFFIDQVDLKSQQPQKIIECVLNAWIAQNKSQPADDEGSDLEIISDDNDFSCKLLEWYSLFFKDLESKYPDAFDKVIKQEMSSDNKLRKACLSKVLGFNPAIAHKVGGAYLFENLNHSNPEIRREAVTFITKEFKSLHLKSKEFVKDSIVNRLHDDNPGVVREVLSIPDVDLNEILDEVDLSDVFTHILSQQSKQWKPVIKQTILKMCKIDNLPVNHDTLLSIMPYLFPFDHASCQITWHILSSSWGNKLGLIKMIDSDKSVPDKPQVLRQLIFKALFINNSIQIYDLLDITRLNKNKTTDVVFYLLLKTCSIEHTPIEDVISILDLLLESVEKRTIISSEISNVFNDGTVLELIKLAKHDEILFELLDFIFIKITQRLNPSDVSKPWCNFCVKPKNILVRRLFELFITGCSIPGYSETYIKLLQQLFKRLFKNAKEKFDFVANIACGHILYAANPNDLINPALQLRSLKLLGNFITVQKNETWLYDSDVLIVMVLSCLSHPIKSIREATINFIDILLQQSKDKNVIYIQFLRDLQVHKEEMLIDHEQVSQVIKKILTQQSIGNKLSRKNCMLKLTGIIIGDTPAFIKSVVVKLLSNINNANIYSHIIPSLKNLLVALKCEGKIFDIYESTLFTNVLNQLNENTISAISKHEVWEIVETGLKQYKECILQDTMEYTSPCVLILKQINEDVFAKVPDDKCKDLINLITSAGTSSNNPNISSVAAKTIKKIHMKLVDFKPLLEKMLNVSDPADVPKKKKSTISMYSYQVVETDEWRLGVTLLEYIQNKKKMTLDNTFVSILFQVLNKCQRFEEQSYVEYTKQLILSSLWYYCKKYIDDQDQEQVRALKSVFDVELIVQCIRGTQNPQTNHHALMLLSQAAYILPEQVLHHTMEIFTFIGSSVLRHDDAYSFQIITKIIETLIPILVKMNKEVQDYTRKELEQLRKRVVPVLRIFADVVLHVPEHRRLPLYKKLIETLGANEFLWVFLALLLETHISHFNDEKKKDNKQTSKSLADKESPINRIDFGQSIVLEFPPEVALENFIKLTVYMKSLPLLKDDDAMETSIDPSEIFSVNGHSAIQLRHYKYVIVTFLNTCLSLPRFIEQCSQATEITAMELHFKSLVVNILTFIQSITKIKDEKTAKYWRVMLHHSYDFLDHVNNLLSAPMFISVIRGLMTHTLQTVQRKSMELLNLKIQCSPEMFDTVDHELMFSLLPSLLRIVKTIGTEVENVDEAQDLELNQQTALLSLKLLTRMLASKDPEAFQPVLELVTDQTCSSGIPPNVMASIVLCLAELCANLKAYSLSSLRKFMPALIKVLKTQRKAETPELVLLSTVTAISKIVESMPLFLSPYLQKIIYEYSILSAKWLNNDQECNKVSAIISKLLTIKKKLASSIPPRVLIPVANETHKLILNKQKFDAVAPVMSLLADSFANITTADFTALQQDLTSFFISALQLRCDAGDIDADLIDGAEGEVVKALVSLVLKLSETSFRPFYFKIYDWAIRTNIEGHKERAITFYRLSSAIADKLKGLFVLFAGHFIKNAAELLDACNNSKTEQLYFDSEEKCIILVKNILKTLHIVFLYDSQNFLNKSRFETLMQPVVDQLENTLGGIPNLKARAEETIIPCISQFAVATGDDSLWKLLNYQVLLKTRHNDAEIRLTALECLVAIATQLGSNWLPLLAESVPFFAELLEDGDQRIETATKNAVRTLEQILGEPLEKYF